MESVINQTFKEIEIIAINDGSTDNSLEILEKFAKRDCRIRIYDQHNQGLSITRNKGINISLSDHIIFIDSDDTIDLLMLEKMYNKMVLTNAHIVHTLIKHIYKNKIIKATPINEDKKQDILKNVLSFQVSSCIPVNLFKKELFLENNIRFPENQFYEDSAVAFKLFYYSKRTEIINEYFYNYNREIENSITTKCTKKHINDLIKGLNQIYKFLITNSLIEKYKISFEIRFKYSIFNMIKLINNVNISDQRKIFLIKYLFTLLRNEKFFNVHNSIIYQCLFHMMNYFNNISYEKIKILFLQERNTFDIEKIYRDSFHSLGLMQYVLNYLIRNKITKICVYGAGEILKLLEPQLEKNNIAIQIIFDSNPEIMIYRNYKVCYPTKSMLDNNLIVITSIMFSKEISEKLYSLSSSISIISIDTILLDIY